MTADPLPPQIARLPRDGGTPVPWATQSSGGAEHAAERESGPVLVCTCRAGRGRARFGTPCVNRQRQSMQERRCSICGTAIEADQVCVWTLADTSTRYYMEGPAHPRCLAFALRVCPKLASIVHRLHVVQALDYRVWQPWAVGASPAGPVFRMIPLGEPSPGVIELYALAPIEPVFTPAALWLADRDQGT